MKTSTNYDLVIIGAGIVGISAGIAALEKYPTLKVLILEKSCEIALHASGRNSGVLHAGFYYSPESLKARFCKEGNSELKKFAKTNGLAIRECGKVVVAKNESDSHRLIELFNRGISNGVEIELLPESELYKYEPHAKTINYFIWSPTTAVLDPAEVMKKLLEKFIRIGGKIEFMQEIKLNKSGGEILALTSTGAVRGKQIINAAGAQSDLLAKQIGVGLNFHVVPFKGNYRKSQQKTSSRRLIYPVPHPINPFLGVHTTITMDGHLKIGPTAIPALGRENYAGFKETSIREIFGIFKSLQSVGRGSTHNLLEILKLELPLLLESSLKKSASQLSSEISQHSEWEKTRSGIRSQLVDQHTGELIQDFKVEKSLNSLHFLNVVSPGWTSALPFTRHFIEDFVE